MPRETITRALPAFVLPFLPLLGGCDEEPVEADTSYEESMPAPVDTTSPDGEPVPDNEVGLNDAQTGGGMGAGGS